MRAANRIVQGLWIGPRLSRMEQASIASFLAHGHDYHLYAYDPIENVPAGARVLDGSAILPRDRIFQYREHASYAGFANFFRYKLLVEKGGWWVDSDLICVRPFDVDGEYVFSSQVSHVDHGGGETVNVGAIKVPAGAPIARDAWDICNSKDTRTIAWGETGPNLFATLVRRHGLERAVQPPAAFCPVAWFDWMDVLDPSRALAFGDGTYAVHLWNEMWRRGGFDKDDDYDEACFYERAQAHFLPRRSRSLALPSAPAVTPAASAPLKISAVVLTRDGASRLARCLASIQDSGFVDEMIVCVDAATTDDSAAIARQFTPQVHQLATAGFVESALEHMTSLCTGDFVLRLDDDETLGGTWDRTIFELLMRNTRVTHVSVPRRWLVPGELFVAETPWFPDLQMRLYVNDRSRLSWPVRPHEPLGVIGHELVLYDRWLNHFALLDRPRGERRRRAEVYRQLNPSLDHSAFYLDDAAATALMPITTTAIDAARITTARPPDRAAIEYKIGSVVDFSSKGAAVDYLRHGWSRAEDWGTWTLGPRAEIALPLAAPIEGAARLTASVVPYLTPRHPTQRVVIHYRQRVIGHWSFDRGGVFPCTVSIDAALIADDECPAFAFEILEPRSPAEAGDSADTRLLGLGFQSLMLERAR